MDGWAMHCNGHVPSTHAIVINSGHSIIYLGRAFILLFSKISRSGHFISSLEQAVRVGIRNPFSNFKELINTQLHK